MSNYSEIYEQIEKHTEKEKTPHKSLIAFLYLIMRDELPTGKVCNIITQIQNFHSDEIIYSNPHLHDLAKDYATRITEETNN